MRTIVLFICVGMASGLLHHQGTQAAEKSPRRTETVRLIENCLPSVVSLRVLRPHPKPGIDNVNFGTGCVIDAAGYVLTNDHVVHGAIGGEAMFADGRKFPFKIIVSAPEEDLAIIKLDDQRPFPALTLGRSHDLILGEPVVVIGTPEGLHHSVSRGIVSGLDRSTKTQHAILPSMLQTDAGSSGGFSGSPLINALSQQIGVLTSRKKEAENVAFAITIDHVRKSFPWMIAGEKRFGFQLGLQVDPLRDGAIVVRVEANTPAAKAGIQKGDVVLRMDRRKIESCLDYQLALLNRKPGEQLKLKVERNGKLYKHSLTLAEFL